MNNYQDQFSQDLNASKASLSGTPNLLIQTPFYNINQITPSRSPNSKLPFSPLRRLCVPGFSRRIKAIFADNYHQPAGDPCAGNPTLLPLSLNRLSSR